MTNVDLHKNMKRIVKTLQIRLFMLGNMFLTPSLTQQGPGKGHGELREVKDRESSERKRER